MSEKEVSGVSSSSEEESEGLSGEVVKVVKTCSSVEVDEGLGEKEDESRGVAEAETTVEKSESKEVSNCGSRVVSSVVKVGDSNVVPTLNSSEEEVVCSTAEEEEFEENIWRLAWWYWR